MKDYVGVARQYEEDVRTGVVSACRWVKLACRRNQRDLERQNTEDFPYRFDADAARKICQFAEQLPHVKGPKAVRTGEFYEGSDGRQYAIWASINLEPWQCWLLTTIFGWLRVEDGLRRFRVAFPLVPRKNAKSTIGAIVVLFMLTCDGESGAECYSAATTREQAKAVAEIAWEMAKRSRSFCEFFGIRIGSETTKTLYVPGTASKFLPLSADANSLDGLNVSLAVIDELHAHKTRGVWDVLDTATGARLQPMLFPITTAGVELGGICYEKVQYLEKVLEGTFTDETFFGVYFTLDDGDDWRLESTHRKANPNYGVSVQADDLVRKANAAEQSPAAINNFLTKHLNVWVRSEAGWMLHETWRACGNPELRIEDFIQFPCWIGVDLAEVRDIAAKWYMFLVAPERFVGFGRFYLPEAAVQSSPIAQMSGWTREGHRREPFIIETPGDQADFLRIEDELIADCDRFKVQEIDFDRALASQMQQGLKRRLEPRMGRDAVDRFVLTVPQNVETMDGAMKMTERLVLSKHLQHDANPAMAWMISNVVVERNYKDEIYPRKAGGKDSPNKIDGPVAMFTCLSRAMQGAVKPPEYSITILSSGRR